MQKIQVKPQPKPYNLFMLGLCVYVLVILAYQTLFKVDPSAAYILNRLDTVICFFFLIDFFWSLLAAPRKLQYLKWGWIDLISSIPMIEPLRWGRFVRVFRILRLLRGIRATKTLSGFLLEKRAQSTFGVAVLLSILVVTFGSISILSLERTTNANILTPSDALWWSFVTVTTVGYGDHYPVTPEGRAVAALLMVVGVGLFGTFTGFIASWFIEPGEKDQDKEIESVRRDLRGLREQISEVKDLLVARESETRLP